jgi:hypothetical protein
MNLEIPAFFAHFKGTGSATGRPQPYTQGLSVWFTDNRNGKDSRFPAPVMRRT